MIDRQHGRIVFCCDECGDTYDSGTSDFDDAWLDAKDEGWRAHKDETGAWCHACSDCREAS